MMNIHIRLVRIPFKRAFEEIHHRTASFQDLDSCGRHNSDRFRYASDYYIIPQRTHRYSRSLPDKTAYRFAMN